MGRKACMKCGALMPWGDMRQQCARCGWPAPERSRWERGRYWKPSTGQRVYGRAAVPSAGVAMVARVADAAELTSKTLAARYCTEYTDDCNEDRDGVPFDELCALCGWRNASHADNDECPEHPPVDPETDDIDTIDGQTFKPSGKLESEADEVRRAIAADAGLTWTADLGAPAAPSGKAPGYEVLNMTIGGVEVPIDSLMWTSDNVTVLPGKVGEIKTELHITADDKADAFIIEAQSVPRVDPMDRICSVCGWRYGMHEYTEGLCPALPPAAWGGGIMRYEWHNTNRFSDSGRTESAADEQRRANAEVEAAHKPVGVALCDAPKDGMVDVLFSGTPCPGLAVVKDAASAPVDKRCGTCGKSSCVWSAYPGAKEAGHDCKSWSPRQ